MFPPSHRGLRVVGGLVVVLLLALAAYPGTFAAPYATGVDRYAYSHSVVPESSALADAPQHYDLDTYRYEALSPAARTMFDRTRTASVESGARRYVPDVCREFLLVCDARRPSDLPREFTYGTELSVEASLVVIEYEGARYLLQTGTTSRVALFTLPLRVLTAWLTTIPLAVVVALATARAETERALAGAVVAGTAVAALGFLTPYLELAGVAAAEPVRVLALAGVWGGLLVAGGYAASRLLREGRAA